MTDEQRAGLARDHLQKARELIEKLDTAGAGQLDGAKESLADVIELLDELDFEEGNLVAGAEPASVSAERVNDDESDLADIYEFRQDAEEQ